jgi:hypothetical protein
VTAWLLTLAKAAAELALNEWRLSQARRAAAKPAPGLTYKHVEHIRRQVAAASRPIDPSK